MRKGAHLETPPVDDNVADGHRDEQDSEVFVVGISRERIEDLQIARGERERARGTKRGNAPVCPLARRRDQ